MAQDNWQLTEEMAKRHKESGGLWLKLANDKDRAVVVFLGQPLPRNVCFVDGKYVLFDENLKAQGERASLRVAFNVAIYDTKEVKVFEQGLIFFEDLARMRVKSGLEKYAFELQRHGAAKDPKTTYSILPEHSLSAEKLATFQSLVLHDLAAVYAGETTGGGLDSYDRSSGGNPPAQQKSTARADAGAVVDERTAQMLVTHLRALPRAATERFCATFSIARIKELPAEQTARALTVLEDLVAEYDPPAAATPPDPYE